MKARTLILLLVGIPLVLLGGAIAFLEVEYQSFVRTPYGSAEDKIVEVAPGVLETVVIFGIQPAQHRIAGHGPVETASQFVKERLSANAIEHGRFFRHNRDDFRVTSIS